LGEDGLSQLVKQLISERIDSVVQLEVLLLLVRHASQAWTPRAVSDTLRIDVNWAAGELVTLRTRGLANVVVVAGGGGNEPAAPSYQYAPAAPDLDAAVQALIRAYADRRVAVVTFIFSKPIDKIQTFADAFRIRGKGKQDG
jgi:hypothetical protein